jgi:hypothetical protein
MVGAIVIVAIPASRLMHGTQRDWMESAIYLPLVSGYTITMIIGRITRGLWLPGKDVKGVEPRIAGLIALLLLVFTIFGLQPLFQL